MLLLSFFKEGIGDIAGLFAWSHLLYLALALAIIASLIFLTRKQSNQQILKYIKIISIVVSILELLKIVWNITVRENVKPDDYIPLYFCSFFIYTSLIFSFSKKQTSLVFQFSQQFLLYGGIIGGLVFTILPTTSLMVFPFLHVLTFHSLIYHSLMVVVGVWMLRFYSPNLQDIKIYGVGLLIIELVIIFLNYLTDLNLMLLNKPFDLKLFIMLANLTNEFFPYVMAIGQMLLSFYLGYLFTSGIKKLLK